MRNLSLLILAAGLLGTSALTSCKKEEIKTTAKTPNPPKSNSALMKDWQENRIVYGTYTEAGPVLWFCNTSSEICYLEVICHREQVAANVFVSTPVAPNTTFPVVKYKQNGPVTEYFSQVTETIDVYGNSSFSGIQ